jgi:hypothetical protein
MTVASPAFNNMGVQTPSRDLRAITRLVDSLDGVVCAVEVGSWAGTSSHAILQGGAEQLFCVDHWGGNQEDAMWNADTDIWTPKKAFGQFCTNMGALLLDRVIPLVGTSRQWALAWPKEKQIDFVYIDASHEYESVNEDILLWSKLVRPGGVMAGHDWDVYEGVNQAVTERFGDDIQTSNYVWWSKI